MFYSHWSCDPTFRFYYFSKGFHLIWFIDFYNSFFFIFNILKKLREGSFKKKTPIFGHQGQVALPPPPPPTPLGPPLTDFFLLPSILFQITQNRFYTKVISCHNNLFMF